MRAGFRSDVQGLRAIAVGLVVAAHLATYQLATTHHLAGGFIGVDVFFVLSGYLITQLILPAATVVLLAVLVFSAIRVPSGRMGQTVSDSWWSAFFFANWHFAHIGTSYFNVTALSPLQHYWSLSVEEQFYLVWPLLMLLLAPRVSRRTLLMVIGTIAAASLAWSIHITLYAGATSRAAAYFSTPARAYELAIGALLAAAPVPVLRRWYRLVLGLCGLGALVWSTVALTAGAAFPGWEALVPTLATAALLVAGRGSATIVTRLLTLRPLRYIGDISYSLYLWHFPVIVLAPFYLPRAWATSGRVVVELILMLALASASYRFIEQPFQQRRVRLVSSGRRALVLWPVALLLVLVATAASTGYTHHLQQARDQAAASWWAAHPQPAEGAQPATSTSSSTSSRPSPTPGTSSNAPIHPPAPAVPDVAAELKNAVQLAQEGAPFPPGLPVGKLSADSWQTTFGCYSNGTSTRLPHSPTSPQCVLGDRSAQRTIAVVGDSHAGMWLPALGQIAGAHHLRLVPFIKLSCSPYDVIQNNSLTPPTECSDFRAWTLDQLRRLKPAGILVAARGELYMGPTSAASVDEQWQSGVTQVLSAFKAITPHLIVFGDVLGRGSQPIDCLTAPGYREADCLHTPYSIETQSNAVTAAVARSLKATFIRTLPFVCTPTECPLVVGTTILYHDDSHLTWSWVRHLAPLLARRLTDPLDRIAQ